MISFGIKYWFILLIAVALAATGVVIMLYFKNKANKELSKIQVRTLMALRFLSFFFTAILVLSPFFRTLKKMVQDPIIVVAFDNSGSMVISQDSLAEARNITSVKENIKKQLGADFQIIEYTFGENAVNNSDLTFSDKKSNYSNLLSAVNNNHFNQNLGAVILAGDGIYNRGENPVNLLNDINFPVYTIAFGDTTIIPDSRIQNIRVNRTAFLGNKFPVEVDVQCSKVKGEKLKLSILQEGTELESIIISPINDNFFVTKQFILEANEARLQHYSARIEAVEGEKNTSNNTSKFVINVLENKQKILILSEGSHPDIGAIKNTLEQQKTYEVTTFTEDPFPSNLDEYNLIILNQLPSSSKSAAEIITMAESHRIPVLFIVGSHTFLPQLNTLNQGVNIVPLAGSGEESQSAYNPAFATFKLSEDLIEIIPKFPPLLVSFANYELAPEFTPFLYQKLKGIETGKPLMATGKLNGRKTGFILGEGIWRWRLFDYYQNQNHARFNELINQFIQYLALRENEDNFIIEFEPVYSETDDVILNAEVYNDAYEPLNTEEINIEVTNQNEEKFNYTFDPRGENYVLNAGNLPVGNYTFAAEVEIGKEKFTESGSFTVVPVNIEHTVTQANHNMLYRLASLSGGQFYLPSQTETLISELQNSNKLKPVSYFQEMINEMLNMRWIFFVLLLFMSLEWFLRKYWGVY